MKRLLPMALLALWITGAAADDKKADHKDGHVILTPDKLAWKPHPALPPGAMAAVLSGDPSKSGLYAVRVKLPDGYKVPPHWHPTDENVTVIEGTLMIGTGPI